MKDIKTISTLEISKYINFFRQRLLRNSFFEHTIYNTIPYKVEYTISFSLPHGLFLRYGTEPDVWKVGNLYRKFFFIGSLFRNEPKRTRIHNYEFKLVDFYIRGGSVQEVISLFFKLLKSMGREFKLPNLSKQDIVYVTYEDYQRWKIKGDEAWIVVTDYPIDESFFDVRRGKRTKKFEILFRSPKETVEIASAGVVGPNQNLQMYIKDNRPQRFKKIFQKKFIGLGFGIERLIYLYQVNR